MTDTRTKPFDPDRHCGAHPDDERGPCRLPKGWGTKHSGSGRCRKHGGNTPSGKAAATKEAARQAVATYGLPVHIDPEQALLDELARTNGAVLWLEEIIRGLGAEDLIRGTRYVRQTKRTGWQAGEALETEAGPIVHAWLELYRGERKHLTDVSVRVIAAGIETRRQNLAEEQGRQWAEGMRWLITSAATRLALDAEGITVLQELALTMANSFRTAAPLPALTA